MLVQTRANAGSAGAPALIFVGMKILLLINLWTFELPGLKNRPEDIEPNLNYELEDYAQRNGVLISFNKEAHQYYLKFATHNAVWRANFRDLNASITRMATLASGKRINLDIVKDEIKRLEKNWQGYQPQNNHQLPSILTQEQIQQLDLFDQHQLEYVITLCKQSKNLSEAGRKLFNQSRNQKKATNDADRLRKYLAKFSLQWNDL